MSDEQRARLPNTPENVVWKLGQILEIHRPLFKELAGFILQGHRITIVEGNHDAEFYFDEVQTSLRQFIVTEAEKICRRQRSMELFDAESLGKRLIFRAWFQAGLDAIILSTAINTISIARLSTTLLRSIEPKPGR
ncbi:MAG: hypothetical protein R3C68_04130 [Myxococcota bacterium]